MQINAVFKIFTKITCNSKNINEKINESFNNLNSVEEEQKFQKSLHKANNCKICQEVFDEIKNK